VSEVEDWILPDLDRYTMEMEMENMLQMMKLLLARQEEAEAKAETRHEEAESDAKARHEKAEARAVARHERFLAFLDGLTSCGEGMTSCQTETTSSSEEMEATNLEATPDETEATVERQELFEKETNFDTIGSSEDRCEDRRLVVRRRRGAKKRSQDSVGFRQKSSAARKRVIRRAIPAVRKGNIRKGPGKDGSARGAPKGRRLQKTHRISPECNIGIRNRGPKD
jgi:hypothetical protein